MRGAREAPVPRDSLNFRRASLFSRNEFESRTFTIVLHATSSFTYVSVTYGANFSFKGSVDRSLLPSAISCFLHETGHESLKITSARCFFIEMSKEKLEKSERTPPVSWRPWALAYSRDQPYNFSWLSALSKKSCLRSIFSAFGRRCASKSLS